MMDQRQPFVNVFAITHPLWAIAADIQEVRGIGRIEAIQTITFVDDVGNVEIQTYYFMPTSSDRPDWVFEDDVEGPYNTEEEAKARLSAPGQQNPNVFQ
jgi:hypothetical protein